MSGMQLSAQENYSTKSKKAIAYFQQAEKLYNLMEFNEASTFLDLALEKDEKFIEAYLLKAQIFNELKKYKYEISLYEKVFQMDPNFSSKLYNVLGEACLNIGEYEKARKYFENYMNSKGFNEQFRQSLERKIENAEFGIHALENPVAFEPINLGGNVNTPLNEYWPSITADEQTLIITVLVPRPGVNPNSPVSDKTFQEDLYVSHFENGEWTKVYNIGPEINTVLYNEGTQAFSVDGRHLFFTVCNKPGDFGRCDIYHSEKIGNKWTIPENIGPPVSTGAWESHPSFSSDGRTLYFVSNRKGGFGEMDIWKSKLKDDGTWTEPVNLGELLNTPGNEMSPFIHPDNHTLYFASNGRIGMGGMDIYYSRLDSLHNWTEPINLGYPINTYNDEKGLIVDATGDLAYFSSNRIEGASDDIYSFELYSDARPVTVTYVKGKVYDARTKEGIEANFELTDLESDKIVVETKSDKENGQYLVSLPTEKDYAFNIFKKGYMFHSENFSLKNKEDSIETYIMNFALKKIEIDQTIVLKNIFFETDSYQLKPESKTELKKLMRFLEENKDVHIELGGHTDNVGSEVHNKELSLNRAKSVYDFLAENGIPKERLSYKGYWYSIPIESNDTPEGRAKNRRTEFKITKMAQ